MEAIAGENWYYHHSLETSSTHWKIRCQLASTQLYKTFFRSPGRSIVKQKKMPREAKIQKTAESQDISVGKQGLYCIIQKTVYTSTVQDEREKAAEQPAEGASSNLLDADIDDLYVIFERQKKFFNKSL